MIYLALTRVWNEMNHQIIIYVHEHDDKQMAEIHSPYNSYQE